LPFDSLGELRAGLYATHPHFMQIDSIAPAGGDAGMPGRKTGKVLPQPFVNPIGDFYLTNPIARASAVMAECSALAVQRVAVAAE
jgi:NADH-quinone oxidoreductase subunit G